MRKTLIIIMILMIIAFGYLLYAQISGGAVPTFGLPIGGQRALVREHIKRFFEDVKFKNKSAMNAMISSESTIEDIDNFLEKTFGADPNNVDLQSIKIESVELDSTKTRARSIVNFAGQYLAPQKPFSATKLIFLYKNSSGDWKVDIKNLSL